MRQGDPVRVSSVQTYVVGAPGRNYVFVRVLTDEGLEGVGESTLEWVPMAVKAAIEDLAKRHVVGRSPFDIEDMLRHMQRDEFVRVCPIMLSAIGGIEIALWDIVGKALDQPVYNLFGGRVRADVPAYANGWYRGARTPEEFGQRARVPVSMGYSALKFDPFGTADREMTRAEVLASCERVGAVRDAVGPDVEILVECHGRFSPHQAVEVANELERYRPYWIEEPTEPENIAALEHVARRLTRTRLATGERLFGHYHTADLVRRGIVDVLQSDLMHSGGILAMRKLAALADANYISMAPHNCYGPIADIAAVHFDACTTNLLIQESVNDFSVDWRADLVEGGAEIVDGAYQIPDRPGLGVTLNLDAVAEHPYDPDAFTNIWEPTWVSHHADQRALS
jgi:galactonate dehydratase